MYIWWELGKKAYKELDWSPAPSQEHSGVKNCTKQRSPLMQNRNKKTKGRKANTGPKMPTRYQPHTTMKKMNLQNTKSEHDIISKKIFTDLTWG